MAADADDKLTPADLDGPRVDAERLAAHADAAASLRESRLLGFYDRLRERILETVERRGGRLGSASVRALLLVPDIFMLLVRLALDPEVPGGTRALIGGALAYFILPIDLLP